MALFERIMATLTAGLLLAVLVLTAAHFVGARFDAPRERKAVVIVGPLVPAVDPAEESIAGEGSEADPGV